MATDIKKLKNAQPILNGSMVTSATKTGTFSKNTPPSYKPLAIESIESKYENRFKHITVIIGG